MKYNMHTARKGMKACFQIAEYCLSYANIAFLSEKNISFIQVSQAQKLKELKELSLPTVAEELRQQSFWRSFLSSKTYVLTP